MEKYNIQLNSIIIIQSLPPNDAEDPRTGDDVFELTKMLPFNHEGLEDPVKLINVYSKQSLFDALTDIAEQCLIGLKPILHFEIHGEEKKKEGIILHGSNEYVSWDEIKPYFIKINTLMNNTLIVCLGVCFGGNAEFFSIDLNKRSPFMLLIGSYNELYPEDIWDSFANFYKLLLFEKSLTDAMKIVKGKNIFKLFGSQFVIAEYLKITLESLKESNLRKEFLEEYKLNKDKKAFSKFQFGECY